MIEAIDTPEPSMVPLCVVKEVAIYKLLQYYESKYKVFN